MTFHRRRPFQWPPLSLRPPSSVENRNSLSIISPSLKPRSIRSSSFISLVVPAIFWTWKALQNMWKRVKDRSFGSLLMCQRRGRGRDLIREMWWLGLGFRGMRVWGRRSGFITRRLCTMGVNLRWAMMCMWKEGKMRAWMMKNCKWRSVWYVSSREGLWWLSVIIVWVGFIWSVWNHRAEGGSKRGLDMPFLEARKLGKEVVLPKPPKGKRRKRTTREKLLSSDLWAAHIEKYSPLSPFAKLSVWLLIKCGKRKRINLKLECYVVHYKVSLT